MKWDTRGAASGWHSVNEGTEPGKRQAGLRSHEWRSLAGLWEVRPAMQGGGQVTATWGWRLQARFRFHRWLARFAYLLVFGD